MKNLVFCFIIIVSSQFSFAQLEGKVFPAIEGQILQNNKTLTLPKDTYGKYTLVGMAYSKGAEDELETWLQPAFDKFIAKTGMWDAALDVNLYFIPMFTGVNKLTAETARKKIKEKTDKDLLPHILFYVGDLDQYRQELDFEKRDTPYFFVLDKNGKIVYAVTGKYTESKMEKINDILLD